MFSTILSFNFQVVKILLAKYVKVRR